MPAPIKPFVLWLTGLSGAGKTTLGREVYARLKPGDPALVFIDGDTFREIIGDDLGHDPQSRFANAFRLSRFCRYLSSQNVSVICATMSLHPEIWQWNRENIPGYREVYLKAEQAVVRNRDPKGLYARAAAGAEKNIVGVDLPLVEPSSPHLVLENNESGTDAINRSAGILCEFLGR